MCKARREKKALNNDILFSCVESGNSIARKNRDRFPCPTVWKTERRGFFSRFFLKSLRSRNIPSHFIFVFRIFFLTGDHYITAFKPGSRRYHSAFVITDPTVVTRDDLSAPFQKVIHQPVFDGVIQYSSEFCVGFNYSISSAPWKFFCPVEVLLCRGSSSVPWKFFCAVEVFLVPWKFFVKGKVR